MGKRTAAELEQGMDDVLASPRDEGPVRLIVRRTGPGQREILAVGELDPGVGLVGDDWVKRPSRSTGQPSPYAQLTVMNARFAELIADDAAAAAWAQAGDQLYLDLDLSQDNLPAGTRLAVGSAIIETRPSRTPAVPSSAPASGRTPCASPTPSGDVPCVFAVPTRWSSGLGVVRLGDLARRMPAGD